MSRDSKILALHVLARAALRVRPPLRAKALVDHVGRHLPPLHGVADVQAAILALFPAGSCLTRAITVAALVPGAEVVLGMKDWRSARASAHAWLEIDGVTIDTEPRPCAQLPDELARLPPTPPGLLP